MFNHTRLIDIPFAVVDLETTGFRRDPGTIVEVAVVHLDPGCPPVVVLNTLVRPSTRIGNRGVHGITNRDVRHAPNLAEIADCLVDALLDRVLVAHNAVFDLAFIESLLVNKNLRSAVPVLCTQQLHRLAFPSTCAINLEDACRSVGTPPPTQAHSAAQDATACARLVHGLIERLKTHEIHTVGDLRVRWKSSFADSLLNQPLSREEAALDCEAARPRCLPRAPHTRTTKPCSPPSPVARPPVVTLSPRAVEHARLLARLLDGCASTGVVTNADAAHAQDLVSALQRDGWSLDNAYRPGDS